MLLAGLEVPTWALLAGVISVLIYYYSTRHFNVFKKAGIPGPRPLPLVGTTYSTFGKSALDTDMENHKQYGKFVGTFVGSVPTLMVTDADWLKEAFIKNFTLTTDRSSFSLGGVLDYGLFSLNGEHWKYVRSMLSPTFTQGKLKKMLPAIIKCEQTFVDLLRKENGKPVEIRTKIHALTMDVIANTAFGIETDSQTNSDSRHLRSGVMLLKELESPEGLYANIMSVVKIILSLFGNKTLIAFLEDKFHFSVLHYDSMKYFEDLCDQVIRDRAANEEPGHDFVQSLADKIVKVDKGDPDALCDQHGNLWTRKGLLKQEVLGNAFLFLFAGFETTADTMLFATYEFAHNQEKQQKAYNELVSVVGDEELSMEHLSKLHYLEWCLQETMRLYPQGFQFDRVAAEDFTLRGVSVKKGTVITACPFVCHRDPEIWKEPDEFIPERFSPENIPDGIPSAYMPFGLGNRACIGNRLALLEMKTALALTLSAFRIDRCPETPSRPMELGAVFTITPKSTVYVKFTPRDEATKY